ncbi:F-type H+-transporting ATPase subunit delta [Variovorax boronicumulans]|uniref:ATP synthase subunit delta n=1 Tax=Variovorax boronicumulans TaxID=436515 RepID=A0AAW8E7T9_9BURK|nr:F0F1 ATP synthase subunit delta [Variovorax boronicumulans]MDP9881894.1 F-type H+-transporting ATPase subunit delta [Variovorax boronicumulans]MDP9919190.1 F-type H+-transporting ATPase subunit delta [Variovorax boronicumulans]MDP9927227.1 F-type H+-transporting ATPase subunit delta [Variovorax boronicumulans]
MAELATIARPYADALFEATSSDLEGTAGWIGQLAALAADPQLLQFAADPKVSPEQIFDLISGLLPQALPDTGKNFLRTVIDNGRLAALPEVAAQYRELKNAKGGTADAVIYSAFPIDAASLAEVAVALQRRFGRPLNTRVESDPSLIGGIRVVVGDEVLDTSVKARLEQMKAALTA